jgi:two-component system LytT family response regulator
VIKAMVIDDELYARDELIELLKESGQIDVIASCSNAIDGLKQLNTLKPEVLFLDIQMPQVTGLEMLSMLDPDTMPKIVFVTAYDEFALKAFEDNAFDYLLKPVEAGRLNKTLLRLQREQKPHDFSPLSSDQLELIPCSGHNRFTLLTPKDIEIAFVNISGVHVASGDTVSTTQLTLKVLEEKTSLIRCHRQYLIQPTAITEIKLLENGLAEITTTHGHIAPVSRRYLKELKERFGLH